MFSPPESICTAAIIGGTAKVPTMLPVKITPVPRPRFSGGSMSPAAILP
ncbi:hypothetical protein HRbin03_00265 [archaeon HR03]|nr:hypothetical protein HRbin03_00265 [archaeon HR03]